MKKEQFIPEVCKDCLVRATCSKNLPSGTLCEKANKELRSLIFSLGVDKDVFNQLLARVKTIY
jgi:hypothetical protein